MAYIDKDSAIRTAIDMCVKVVGHGITQIDAVDIVDAFENIPTVDVVEVKHGYWKRGQWVDDYNAGGYYLAECNLCGCTQKKASNFCPNCGARMKGGESNA